MHADEKPPDAGFSIFRKVFKSSEIDALIAAVRVAGGGAFAIRNLLQLCPAIAILARSAAVLSIVETALAREAFPVRGMLFDKTGEANWLVPWHQDLTICVADRIDVPGYGPWTKKAGVWHVQPPVGVLEQMVAVRIHLDDCDEGNGALRVLPGTHQLGRLTTEAIAEQRLLTTEVSCNAKAGDVMLMRPLILHASSAAKAVAHRRVIHIDYASSPLEGGLQWTETESPGAQLPVSH